MSKMRRQYSISERIRFFMNDPSAIDKFFAYPLKATKRVPRPESLPGGAMTSYRDRYFRTLKTLDTFADRALGLTYKDRHLSGFHYTCDLLRAASANTYLETVGSRADSIHLAIKQVPTAEVYWEYRKTVEILGGQIQAWRAGRHSGV